MEDYDFYVKVGDEWILAFSKAWIEDNYVPYEWALRNVDLNAKDLINVKSFQATGVKISGLAALISTSIRPVGVDPDGNIVLYEGGGGTEEEVDPVFTEWLSSDPLAGFITTEEDPVFGAWLSSDPLAGFISGSLTQYSIPVADASGNLINGTLSQNASGHVDANTKNLINIAALAIGSSDPGTSGLYIAKETTGSVVTQQMSIDTNTGAGVAYRKSRGTISSPTVVLENDIIGGMVGQVYSGDAWRNAGILRFYVDGQVTTTSVPGRIEFQLMPEGGYLNPHLVTVGKISNNGRWSIGGSHTATHTLHVAGTARVTGNSWIQGNMGIGIETATEQLHTTGGVRFQGLAANTSFTRVAVADNNNKLWHVVKDTFCHNGVNYNFGSQLSYTSAPAITSNIRFANNQYLISPAFVIGREDLLYNIDRKALVDTNISISTQNIPGSVSVLFDGDASTGALTINVSAMNESNPSTWAVIEIAHSNPATALFNRIDWAGASVLIGTREGWGYLGQYTNNNMITSFKFEIKSTHDGNWYTTRDYSGAGLSLTSMFSFAPLDSVAFNAGARNASAIRLSIRGAIPYMTTSVIYLGVFSLFNTFPNARISEATLSLSSRGGTGYGDYNIYGSGSTGTTSSLKLFNSSGVNLFNFRNDGYLGIGITPTEQLHTTGGVRFQGITQIQVAQENPKVLIQDVNGKLFFQNLTSPGGFVNPMTSIGDIIVGGTVGAATRLSPNETTTKKYLRSYYDNEPTPEQITEWGEIAYGDIIDTPDLSGYLNTGSITVDYIPILKSTGWANSKFYENPTNGRVGLGTTAPEKPFHVVADDQVWFDRHKDDSIAAGATYNKSRGTQTSPVACNIDDVIGEIRARAYYNNAYRPVGNIQFKLKAGSGNLAAGAITFRTLRNQVMADAMVLTKDGYLGLGLPMTNNTFNIDPSEMLHMKGGNLRVEAATNKYMKLDSANLSFDWHRYDDDGLTNNVILGNQRYYGIVWDDEELPAQAELVQGAEFFFAKISPWVGNEVGSSQFVWRMAVTDGTLKTRMRLINDEAQDDIFALYDYSGTSQFHIHDNGAVITGNGNSAFVFKSATASDPGYTKDEWVLITVGGVNYQIAAKAQ